MRNDSFSLKFYPDPIKKLANGEIPIYLRIRVNRKKAELATRMTMKNLDDWEPVTGRVKVKSPINSRLNQIEGEITSHYHQLKHSGRIITANALKNLFLGRDQRDITLTRFFDTTIKERIQESTELKPTTIRNYNSTINHLLDFLDNSKQKSIELRNIDDSFLRKWDNFLLKKACLTNSTVTLHRNTINKYHTKFKVLLNIAVEEEIIDKNPYRKFRLKYVSTRRTFLTRPELDKLENHDLGKNQSLIRVRDKFLFSVYTGLRFADADNLRSENIEFDGKKYWVVLTQQKTGEYLRIPLLNKGKEIYDKYEPERILSNFVLPRLTNQKINAYLKVIGNMVGIEKPLTHHVARHTAATTIFLSNGVPLEIVSKQLGHANIKTTQIYAKITNEMLSNAADKLNEILR